MKFKYHDFAECIESLADLQDFDRWETRSQKEYDSYELYIVDFLNAEGRLLFSKSIVVDTEDHSAEVVV
ncbi:hypothetical protein [Alkalihalophilus marmarensis]|uniref:hypothetical protein n=1 Tax=Alkalihalophilus marmarensis TaxID=521377 RepID=UPI002E1D0FA8|nr:hypothetical protein [Alkalihalophilus marmarensis]